MRLSATLVMLAEFALGGCAPQPVARASAPRVLEAGFHAQCPFGVAQPSLSWVRDASGWERLRGTATVDPLPIDFRSGQRTSEHLLVIAAPSTPTPMTRLRLAGEALRVDAPAGVLRMAVDVRQEPAAPGGPGIAVIGRPCLVVHIEAISGVVSVEARDALHGELIARTAAP